MPDRPDLNYCYDGSFEGLLCCVFESYACRETPVDIFPANRPQTTLFPAREIVTRPERAARVLRSIPRRLGPEALPFVQKAFLTCLGHKELMLLRFLCLGYRAGPVVLEMLTHPTVAALASAVQKLEAEAYHYKGFVRFSDFEGALAAEIEPKNFVLPFLAGHFCARFPEEKLLIFDKTHGMALLYQPYSFSIRPAEGLELSEPGEVELEIRRLWRLFYRTVEVEDRHNPRCRMTHMPKRFWNELTEFGALSGPR